MQSTDGTALAVDRSGAGPALVLVVGAFGDRSSTKTLPAGLGSTFTVYEYDRRGRGASGTYIETYISNRMTTRNQPQQVVHHAAPDVADQTRKLASLRDDGILTEKEFQAKKATLLG